MPLSPLDLLHLTTDSLRGNPLRSALTTFGVFMGVAAVNATLQVANISTAVIERQLAEREAPKVFMGMQGSGSGKRLTIDDMEFLQQRLANLQAISTSIWVWEYREVVFQDQQLEIEAKAVSQDYLLTSGRKILQGRFFNKADFDNYRPVAVVDRVFAEQLFGAKDPVNQRFYAGGKPYTVVGVMETKLQFKNDEPSGEMVIPLSLYTAITGSFRIGGLELRPQKVDTLKDMEILKEKTEQLLQQRFPEEEFWGWNNAEDILEQKQTLAIASRGLLGVGAIALLVAGVGIANITVASVMERTKEIGLRRAIGAKRRDIMMQFILEAVLMSLIGGIGAIAVVDGLSRVVANRFELPYKFEGSAAGLSLGAALLVGVGSSFLPALRASQLEPVKALRSD